MAGYGPAGTGGTGRTGGTGGSSGPEGSPVFATVIRPIGISPTRDHRNYWYPGVKWPPSDQFDPTAPDVVLSSTLVYPDSACDPSLFAIAVIGQFVQTKHTTAPTDWTQIAVPHWTDLLSTQGRTLKDEIVELVELIDYRPDALQETLAQATDFVHYWGGMLMFNQQSHPWTFRVARTAIAVGEFTMMHYKRRFSRPRPSQISPDLMPPIAVPPHASYPSGHSTQAWLLSRLLEQVLPSIVGTPAIPQNPVTPPMTPTAPAPVAQSLLYRLAERVARNREVMGLHYPSDTSAGQILAKGIFDILMDVQGIPIPDAANPPASTSFMSMKDVINHARVDEWGLTAI